jgi:phosphoribosylglycinamide formyltransferase-1
MTCSPLVPSAVFVSGSGTNLQAVIDASKSGELPLDLRIVVSNVPGAFALERARLAGIPTAVVQWRRGEETREAYGARLAATVHERGARLVLLLGWMHVLASEFLEAGFEAVLNLHPGFLPDDPSADSVTLPDGSHTQVFRGAHALRDALEAKVPMTGATLIEISPEIDRGPVLARRLFALRPDDDEASALARLHAVEHEVVKEGVLKWIAVRAARPIAADL